MNLKATLRTNDVLRAKANIGGKGSGGASDWEHLKDKPFETLGDDFTVNNGALEIADGVIPSLDGYATEDYVDSAVAAITPSIPVVSATSTLSVGTQIGSITVDGETTTFYAPESGLRLRPDERSIREELTDVFSTVVGGSVLTSGHRIRIPIIGFSDLHKFLVPSFDDVLNPPSLGQGYYLITFRYSYYNTQDMVPIYGIIYLGDLQNDVSDISVQGLESILDDIEYGTLGRYTGWIFNLKQDYVVDYTQNYISILHAPWPNIEGYKKYNINAFFLPVDDETIKVNSDGELYAVAATSTVDWSDVNNKPFNSIGAGLEVVNGKLKETVPIGTEVVTTEYDWYWCLGQTNWTYDAQADAYIHILTEDEKSYMDTIGIYYNTIKYQGSSGPLRTSEGVFEYDSANNRYVRMLFGGVVVLYYYPTTGELVQSSDECYNIYFYCGEQVIEDYNLNTYPFYETETVFHELDADYINIDNDTIISDSGVLKANIPTVPTNVSAFTNDAGYITSADLPQADGTTIIDNNGVWSAVGGGAEPDEKSIITNAQGKLEEAVPLYSEITTEPRNTIRGWERASSYYGITSSSSGSSYVDYCINNTDNAHTYTVILNYTYNNTDYTVSSEVTQIKGNADNLDPNSTMKAAGFTTFRLTNVSASGKVFKCWVWCTNQQYTINWALIAEVPYSSTYSSTDIQYTYTKIHKLPADYYDINDKFDGINDSYMGSSLYTKDGKVFSRGIIGYGGVSVGESNLSTGGRIYKVYTITGQVSTNDLNNGLSATLSSAKAYTDNEIDNLFAVDIPDYMLNVANNWPNNINSTMGDSTSTAGAYFYSYMTTNSITSGRFILNYTNNNVVYEMTGTLTDITIDNAHGGGSGWYSGADNISSIVSDTGTLSANLRKIRVREDGQTLLQWNISSAVAKVNYIAFPDIPLNSDYSYIVITPGTKYPYFDDALMPIDNTTIKANANGLLETAIPAAPTTAGTYTLQVVVDAQGNPTYSWI